MQCPPKARRAGLNEEIMKASRSRATERGAAAVEFALVLPILLMLIFGIVDFGRMLSAKITITEAAREGARAAALVGRAEGESRARAAADGLAIDRPDVQTCTSPPGPTDDATVTVTYQFEFITPISLLLGATGDGKVELKAKGVMPCLS
jgi:Flp pilus assembly protein TadG